MKPFAVARTQGQFLVNWLLANRELRSLGVELRVPRLYDRGRSRVLRVPFLALGKIELQAVCAGEIPGWAGHGNTDFLVEAPNISINS